MVSPGGLFITGDRLGILRSSVVGSRLVSWLPLSPCLGLGLGFVIRSVLARRCFLLVLCSLYCAACCIGAV
jgi:hypothetical protein